VREVLKGIYLSDLRLTLVIFALALMLRGALVLSFRGDDPVFSDLSYQRMAENYAEGRGLGMPDVYPGAGRIYVRAFRPPLFPFLWGLAYPWTREWYTPLRWAHAVLSSLTCVLLFFVGRRWLGRPSGLVGAALCAISPAQVWHGVHAMTEPLFLFFLVLTVHLLLRLAEKPSALAAAGAGVSAALGVLSRSVLVGFVPLAALWLVLALPRRKWLTLLFLLGFAGAMSPWWVRNWQVFHRFVLTTTDSGHGFLIGNNEKTLTDPRGVYVPTDWGFLKDVIHDETAINRRLWRKGMDYLTTHPGVWARLAFDKFCRFWRFYPHTRFVSKKYAVIHGVSYALVFPFIVAGAILSFRELPAARKGWWLISLLVIYMTGIHMVFIAVTRYREPLMPFLFCLAGYAVARVIGGRPAAQEAKTPFFA
jgi:4-amino-4-deoxy-L-arabinose transferase-like glycosyltransferase